MIIFFIGTILFLFFLGSKWQNSETVNIRNNNECFCAQRKNPIGHQKTKPQMKMVIGLWFSDFLMCPEHYCDWSIQNWLVRLKAKYKPLYFLLSTVWYQNSFAFFKSFVFFIVAILIQLLFRTHLIFVSWALILSYSWRWSARAPWESKGWQSYRRSGKENHSLT